MSTPPSSGHSFQHKVQGRQSLRDSNFSSNSTRKDARLGNPSYVGNVLSYSPTLQEDLVILAHFVMETSFTLFFPFSTSSPKLDVQEITLHISFPLVTGFI